MKATLKLSFKKTFDLNDRLLTLVDNQKKQYSEEYQYDELGRTVYLRHGNYIEITKYDENGIGWCTRSDDTVIKLTFTDSHELQTVENAVDGSILFEWTYNDKHQITSYKTKNKWTRYYYDDRNNLESRTVYPKGDVYKNINTYDDNGKLIMCEDIGSGNSFKRGYDTKGNCISALVSNGEYNETLYEYDSDGRIVSEVDNIFNVGKGFVVNNKNIQQRAEKGYEMNMKHFKNGCVIKYTFAKDGRLIKFKSDTGYCVEYGYDDNLDITSVSVRRGRMSHGLFKWESLED